MNDTKQTLPAFEATSYDFQEYVPARNWIGGEWQDADGGQTLPVYNPRHGKALSSVTMSGAAEVDAAVRAAKAAFAEWRTVPIKERAEVFYQLKYLMQRDLEELSWLVTHENGKCIEQGRASVAKAIECVEFGATLPNLAEGTHLNVSRGVQCSETHVPLGVCAGVTPFNFPVMVPTWMIPQAIAGGNTFVLKPSEVVPLGAMKLAALLKEAGLPDGVFNVVNGAKEVVQALTDHPDVKAMAFVGSTAVARDVYARGAKTGKPMLCLGGAKNHLIVVPDANLELTASNIVASFTGCSGQRCMAAANVVAVGDIQHIIDEVQRRGAELRLGHDLGPIISEAAVARITGYIDEAEAKGARVLVDGRGKRGDGDGWWVGPTIIDGVTPDMKAATEEIFGPVLCIMHADTVDEAIALENANPYGNASSVYTTSGYIAEYVMERVEAGMCGVNIGVPVPREPFGFGGWNDSKFGHGNLTGYDGYRFWTRPRKVTAKWAVQEDWTWMS